MPSIRNTLFAGMRPAVSDRLLEQHYATAAHNTCLTDGTLSAFNAPKLVRTVSDTIAGIFLPPETNSTCVEPLLFDECVSVVVPTLHECAGFDLLAVFPDNGEAYLTDTSGAEAWPLGVEAPAAQLTATLATAGTATEAGPDARSYTYTWVDRFGIESAPAPASQPLLANDTARVRLAGFSAPPDNAETVRIYRTGAKPEGEAAEEVMRFDTPFQLVDELPVSSVASGWTDDRRLAELEFGTLQTTEQCLPPVGLLGVVETDSGYYAGFKGNVLYVSERHQVWNWATYNAIELPDRITGIAESGDIIFIATTGAPVRVRLSLRDDNLIGEQVLTTEVEAVRSEQRFPGVSQRSICATSFGAAYVSKNGLIVMGAQGDAINITREPVGDKRWAELAPSRIVWQHGFIYGISPHKPTGLRLELRGEGDGSMSLGDLVTIDMQGQTLHAATNGKVYYANGNELYAWNEGTAKLTYLWRSKRNVMPRRTAFTAGKVVADYGGEVILAIYKYNDSGSRFKSCERSVKSAHPFRITPGAKVNDYLIELRGTATVHELHVATSMIELIEGE